MGPVLNHLVSVQSNAKSAHFFFVPQGNAGYLQSLLIDRTNAAAST